MKSFTGIVSEIPAFLINPIVEEVKEVEEVESYYLVRPVQVVNAYVPANVLAYALGAPVKTKSWFDRVLNICAPLVKEAK